MKKRYFFKGISLFILLAILCLPLLKVCAQPESITETFDDESLPGWERSEGAVVQDGVLNISPANFAVMFGDYANGTLSVKIKRGGPGIVFIRYCIREEASYTLVMGEDIIILEKSLGELPEELGAHEWNVTYDEWIEVKISVSNGNHSITMDGETIITATDDNPLQGGSIGFWVDGEFAAEFDDLSVSAMAIELPAEGDIDMEEEAAFVEEVELAAQPEVTTSQVSLGDLIEELTSSQANPLELTTFIINLGLSVVLSYILSRVYVHWGSSLSNRRRFASNFILITVTTTFIILVVRSSVALSLGLVGALSIVRFRAAIKEPEELAYLFFAIGIGIGLGDNQRVITILAMVVAIIILGVMRLFRGRQADFNLHVTVASHASNKVELENIMDTLSPHCSQIKLMRFDDTGNTTESSFLVEFRSMENLKQAKGALRGLSDSLEITFLDNKGIW